MKRLRQLFEALDGLEVVFWGIIAGGLLVAGPVYLVWLLVAQDRFLMAAAVGAVWLGTLAGLVWEIRRGRLGWVTTGVAVAGLLATIWLGVQ